MHKLVNGVQVPLTSEEIQEFESRETTYATVLAEAAETNYQSSREQEYPSTQEMLVAIIEDYVEGRPEALAALQERRLVIKAKYPKPSN